MPVRAPRASCRSPSGYVVRPLNVTLTNLFLVGSAATAARPRDAPTTRPASRCAGATVPTIANPGSNCLGGAD